MQNPTPQPQVLQVGLGWGPRVCILNSTGDSDAGNPRITHLESLMFGVICFKTPRGHRTATGRLELPFLEVPLAGHAVPEGSMAFPHSLIPT